MRWNSENHEVHNPTRARSCGDICRIEKTALSTTSDPNTAFLEARGTVVLGSTVANTVVDRRKVFRMKRGREQDLLGGGS